MRSEDYYYSTQSLQFNFIQTRKQPDDTNFSEDHDITEYIPLYSGEVLKGSIDTNKRKPSSFSIYLMLNKKNSALQKNCIEMKEMKMGSYLKMYQSRTNIHNNNCDILSTTGTVSSKPTSRSVNSDDFCFEDNVSSSLLEKQQEGNNRSISECLEVASTTTLNSKLYSVSEQNLSVKKKVIFSKVKPIIKVPVLGALGPDLITSKSKLDLLKKRQQYGQVVSNKNRIKINVTKILEKINNT